MHETLKGHHKLFVKQVFEIAEIIGFESRNKYRVCDEGGRDLMYAAEQQKGFLGFLFRQFLGHWRTFEIHFFDLNRQPVMRGRHPFRWFFQCLEIYSFEGRMIGKVERRFGIFTKKFDVHDAMGRVILEVSSPFWRIWTFPFMRGSAERARVSKKWSGIGYEFFTDRDTFLVEYLDTNLALEERSLILAAAVYIDMMYFERKGSGGGISVFGD